MTPGANPLLKRSATDFIPPLTEFCPSSYPLLELCQGGPVHDGTSPRSEPLTTGSEVSSCVAFPREGPMKKAAVWNRDISPGALTVHPPL